MAENCLRQIDSYSIKRLTLRLVDVIHPTGTRENCRRLNEKVTATVASSVDKSMQGSNLIVQDYVS